MAVSSDVSIRLSVKDAETVKQALKSVGEEGNKALAVMETASDKAAVSARVLSRQVEGVKTSLDPAIAAQASYAKAISVLDDGLARNALTQEDHAKFSALARTRLDELTGALSRGGGALASNAMGWRTVSSNLVNAGQVAIATKGNLTSALGPLIDVGQGFAMMGGNAALAAAGVAAIAAPFALAAAAAYSYAEAQRQLSLALQSSGGYVGKSRADIEAMARAMAPAASLSITAMRDVASAAVSSGTVTGAALGKVMDLARDWGAMIGKDAKDGAEDLARLLANPAKAAEVLADRFHNLTQAEVDHITALAKSGQTGQAQLELLAKIADASANAAGKVGLLSRAWNAVTDAWDGVGRSFAPDSTADKLSKAEEKAATARKEYGDDDRRTKVAESEARYWRIMADAESKAPAEREARNQANDFDTRGTTLVRQLDPLAQRRLDLANQRALLENAIKANPSREAEFRRGLSMLDGQDSALLDPAQLAQRQLSFAQQAATLSPGERLAALARMQAGQEALSLPLDEAGRANYASAKGEAASLTQRMAASDQINALREETRAAADLAKAWDTGKRAALESDAAGQARSAHIANAAVNEGGLTKALLDRGAAQKVADAAQSNDALADQVKGLQSVAQAEQTSTVAATEAARAHDVAMMADKLRTAAAASGSAARMQAAEEEIKRYDDLTRQRDQADNVRQAAMLNRQYDGDKAYEAEIARLQELADTGVLTAKTMKESFLDADLARLRTSKDATDGMMLALKEYGREAENAAAGSYRLTQSSLRGFDTMFANVATNAKKGKDAMKSFVDSSLQELARLFSQKYITGPLASGGTGLGLLSGLGAGLSGAGGWFSDLLGFGSGGGAGASNAAALASGTDAGFWGSFAGFWHGGGKTDRPNFYAPVDPSWFSSAPRHHTGFQPYLASNERAAILTDTEEVLTESDPRHIGNLRRAVGAAGPVNLNVQFNLKTPAGTTGRMTGQRRTADGGFSFDVLVEKVEGAMATNIDRGQGLAPTIENRYGLNAANGSFG